MAVIVLGLLSAFSNGQVGKPVPAGDFGLHINGGIANWSPKNDGLTGFGTFRLWDNWNGTQTPWTQPYLIGPAVPRQVKPAGAEAPVPNAKTEVVLHNFASPPNGAYPAWGVVRDSAGNLYGTTNGAYSDVGGGGTNNAGVVFKVDTSGNETVLHSFTGGADGNSPNGVILDSAGNLYGVTESGGGNGVGVVFKVVTSGETVLYSFTGGNDGGYPNGVTFDSAGNLYGTTTYGGASGAGVVFKVGTSGETVLYTFTGGNDGANPYAGVILDSVGNLYGTTSGGGASGAGVVYKVDTSGNETVLYGFTGGADGDSPYAGVVRDSVGNLYGTTAFGGTAAEGVVFKVDTSGNETVLHTGHRGLDGDQPDTAGVILDSVGNLYGTNAFGGAGGGGRGVQVG
jgi:uncharacterized repeat protein (TIGR03803 family)